MPEPIQRRPRVDDSAADARSLEQLGHIEPQPIPAPSISPFLEPDLPPAPDGEPA
jgi:hypothetical protein